MKRYFILIPILFASLAASAQDYDLAISDIVKKRVVKMHIPSISNIYEYE